MRAPSEIESRGALAPAEARLALTEDLLRSEDTKECALKALAWLDKHAGIRHGLCALVSPTARRVVGVAGHNVSESQVEEFWLDLDDRTNSLVAALSRLRPTHFPPGPRQPYTPLPAGEVHAIPLVDGSEVPTGIGLLLLAASEPAASANVLWAANVLSDRMAVMHGPGRSPVARERTLLYSIINTVTDPILLTDLEGKLIIANARAEKLFLSHEDESEGRRRAVTLNNMLFSAALSSRTMGRSEGARNELLLVDPSEGSDLLFELLSSPILDPAGETVLVSVLRNVTDLGRATAEIGEKYQELSVARAEVRSERHRLDLIIDSVADPIIVTDPTGDIVLMNPPAERIFNPPDGTGEDALRRVRANDAHFSSFVSNLLFTGNEMRWTGEINLLDPKTGAPLPVEAVSGKILSERGELTNVVTILHDRREAIERANLYEALRKASVELEGKVQSATGELARQNELLRRQAIELERAAAAKSQFLANVSHELRTPLNAVLGYTSMMLQGVSGMLSGPQARSLQRVDSNAKHLLDLINQVLDITRIEAGRMPVHASTFAVGELLQEVLSELEPIIARAKLEVGTQVAPKLPELHSDRQKVKQIVLNLLSNALKFTHQGWIRISVQYQANARQFVISVQDTGIGIAPEDQEKVFEDFRQLDNSPTRAYGGTGLGLAICRRLATTLEGKISVKSAVGKGSTFTLCLPRRLKA